MECSPLRKYLYKQMSHGQLSRIAKKLSYVIEKNLQIYNNERFALSIHQCEMIATMTHMLAL